jgi:predicted dehydrogenase
MVDIGVYRLHLMTSILGSVQRVTALSGRKVQERVFKGKKIDVEVDDNTALLLDFGGSTFGVITATFTMLGPGGDIGGLYILGSQGSIQITNDGLEIWSRKLPSHHVVEEYPMYMYQYAGTRPPVIEMVPSPRLQFPYLNELHNRMSEAHVFNDVMHLVHCILHDKEPLVYDNVKSSYHARHVIEIIEKGDIAAKTGITQNIISSLS